MRFIDPDGMGTVDSPFGKVEGDYLYLSEDFDEKKQKEKNITGVDKTVDIVGLALQEVPNAANHLRISYGSILFTSTGEKILVPGRETYDMLLESGNFSKHFFREMGEFVVKNGYVISQGGKFFENSGYIVTGIALGIEYSEMRRIEEVVVNKAIIDMGRLDFGAKAGSIGMGISIGLWFGGPGGAVAGYFIEENIQNGYNTLKWVHEGMYLLPYKILSNSNNWTGK